MAKARGKTSTKLKPENELQEAIHSWLLVVYEFDQWRQQLDKVITGCTLAASNQFYSGDPLVLTNLRRLEQELIEATQKLLSEVDQMEQDGQYIDQLARHTQTIYQWKQKIQYLLLIEAKGTA